MQKKTFFPTMTLLLLALFALSLFMGAVRIPSGDVVSILMGHEAARPSWGYIVLKSRLPQAITAMLCGASLAVSGLMLQTAFRNPLAGPSIFGIYSGASLGVALVMLLMGGSISAGAFSLTGFVAVLVAAFVGAMLVMAIILLFSTVVRNPVMPAQFLRDGTRGAKLHDMGIGQLRRRDDGTDACLRYYFCGCPVPLTAFDQAPQCPALGRTIR